MTDLTTFLRFKDRMSTFSKNNSLSSFLLKDLADKRIYYLPLDYVNPEAKICIMDITPGRAETINVLVEAARLINAGLSDLDVLKRCKHTCVFQEPMRQTLIDLLDSVGFNKKFGMKSCSKLFEDNVELANFSFAAVYPVFNVKWEEESNFKGDLTAYQKLYEFFSPLTIKEITAMSDAWIVPLGAKVHKYLKKVLAGTKEEARLLPPLLHPSGTNKERIDYFLGRKAKGDLGPATNPDKLDSIKESYKEALS